MPDASSAAAGRGLAARLADARIYLEPRLLLVFALGIASGLPLALSGATLSIWLAEAGVSRTAIGAFALVGTAYSLKWAWSPLIDGLPLPVLTRRLGRRRGWLLATQLLLVLAMLGLGASAPGINPAATALWAVVLAFASASQDIVIDAYRVEILEERQFGAGAAMIVFGYRVGMLLSGAGALFLAEGFGWAAAYAVMAAVTGLAALLTLLAPRPPGDSAPAGEREPPSAPLAARLARWFMRTAVGPIAEFLTRPAALWILLAVLLYKLGDALAGVMAGPLYVSLGFSKAEIAEVVKVWGFGATMAGAFLGGIGVSRWGIGRSLIAFGILQALSNLAFAGLAAAGHDLVVLAAAIAFENLTGGMGTAAFVAYLSRLTNVAYTATQYALLSSIAAVGRTLLAAPGGGIADAVGWVPYFSFTALAALPGLLVIAWLLRRPPPAASAATRTVDPA